jgi:hypothetical protein
MNEPSAIRQVELELHDMAQAYAARAEKLATDPYFRDAVVKVSVSSFVWALYHAHVSDSRSLEILRDELIEQGAAISRAISPDQPTVRNAENR